MSKPVSLTSLQMDQCTRWRDGQRVFVENYLRQDPSLGADSEALLDLIYQEIVLRQERGEAPLLEEYEHRFPRLRNQLRLQFEVHQALDESALLGAPGDQSLQAPCVEVLPSHQDLVGQTLGDCRVVRFLGEGAMGRVYLGEQTDLGRLVALKILRPELVAHATTLRRFQAEARAMARAAHPNIVQIHAIGASAGLHFLVMEYVEGRTLRQELAEKGRLEPKQALMIMRQVAAALERAGELGIVHRDIKPDNILLTARGEAKLTDFGLCWSPEEQRTKLTVPGVALGTPLYMSPEQIQSRPIDQRSDIYSFGATCYHMLAGEPPFRGGNAMEVALQHLKNPPMPLTAQQAHLPAGLCVLVHRMLAKKPEDRFVSARALLESMDQIHRDLPDVPVAQLAPPMPPRSRKRRVLSLAVLLLFVLGIGLAICWSAGAPAYDASPSSSTLPNKEPISQSPVSVSNATPTDADGQDARPSKLVEPIVNPPDPPRGNRGGDRHRHGGRER